MRTLGCTKNMELEEDQDELSQLSRSELQQLGKQLGIRANQKSADIIEAIRSLRREQQDQDSSLLEEDSHTTTQSDHSSISPPPGKETHSTRNETMCVTFDSTPHRSYYPMAHTPKVGTPKMLVEGTPKMMRSKTLSYCTPKSALKQALQDERTRRRQRQFLLQQENGDCVNERGSWEKIESRSRPGAFYYWNPNTRQSTWHLPPAIM